MNDNTPNEFASYGLEILKRSVLLVLYEQHTFGPPHRRFMTLKEVGERLDIRPIGRYTNMNGLTHGILLHLSDEKNPKLRQRLRTFGELIHFSIAFTEDPEQTLALETELIRDWQPETNRNKLG